MSSYIDEIEKSVQRIKNINRKLQKLDEDKLNIELRVFTEGGWNTIDFKPKSKPILNMVIHQIRLELQKELKEEKINLKINISET